MPVAGGPTRRLAAISSSQASISNQSFGLTGVWFLVTALLMLRGKWPRLLVLLGLTAVADLAVGFIAALAVLA